MEYFSDNEKLIIAEGLIFSLINHQEWEKKYRHQCLVICEKLVSKESFLNLLETYKFDLAVFL